MTHTYVRTREAKGNRDFCVLGTHGTLAEMNELVLMHGKVKTQLKERYIDDKHRRERESNQSKLLTSRRKSDSAITSRSLRIS